MRRTLILLFIFSTAILNSQPPSRFYTKFGGNGDDIGYSGKQTLDGQYIVAGSTSSYGNGNTDVYLVKVDSMGMLLWEKYIGGFGNDVGKSVIQLADSGYVITGFTNSFGAGGYDAYTIRTDKNGNVIWQKTFGGLDWDFASDLVLGSDGNIFVVGNTVSFGAGKKDGFVLKYDLLGNLIWQKFYGGIENEELRSIIKTNDNFLATVGYTESRGEINGDGYFLKLDLNGDTLFTKTFGGPYKDYANDLVQKAYDDYIIVGARTYSINGFTHSLVYSYGSQGNLTWDNSFYSSTADEYWASVTNSKLDTLNTGFIRDVPVPIVKMQGNIFVTHNAVYPYVVNSFGGGDDEAFFSIEGTRDGGYFISGWTLSYGSLGKDIYIIKLDSTIITYESIVAIKGNYLDNKPEFYYQDNNSVNIRFYNSKAPELVDLIDLNGKSLRKYSVQDEELKINLSDFNNSIYIIRFKYKDGSYYTTKLINR